MKRRDFFKKGTQGALVAGFLPMTAANPPNDIEVDLGDRASDQWKLMGSKKSMKPDRKEELNFDVAVIGAGIAGISAAVSAARNGAKTVLIQDRPVLGGNASSEIRVTVNGAQSFSNKLGVDRETGVVEELLIENWYYNPQESYPMWDQVLYNYVMRQPNLKLMLNTQAVDAVMDGNRIKSAICWQLTSETEFTIHADQFVDCSGDGLLAAKAGAEYRTGREARSEFDESFAPEKADGWVMGDCIMMITRKMDHPVPFYPPDYAIPFDAEKAFQDKSRRINQVKEGYWWIEVGSNYDIIADRETNRHKLLAHFYGVWDYVKNSGNYPEAENVVLDWIAAIPGRRESRRFMGDHILNQKEMETYHHFDDAVAYGGWSLDEHGPGGVENLDEPASYFHSRFKKPYEIPFRSLYSRNIANLLFAGRNVSVTHMALSSTRIIGTCAMMGQAAGTASALCVSKGAAPRELAKKYINDLQEQLLRDDSYIPNRPARDQKDLARQAEVIFASSTTSGDVKLLTDGYSRDEEDKIHHWQSQGLDAHVQLEWQKPILLSKVEVKADTNLQRKMMMHKNPGKYKDQVKGVPPELVKEMIVEARVNGAWKEVAQVKNNITRLIKTDFAKVKTTAVRLKLVKTWGAKDVKLFEVRCYS